MTGFGSRADGSDQHHSHQEVRAVSQNHSNNPDSGAAVVMQKPSFPVCTQPHDRTECKKRTLGKLRILTYESYSRGNGWHLSEDLAQEVVIRLAKSGKTLCEVATSYCITTLKWAIIDHWRKKYDIAEHDLTFGDDAQVYEAVGPPWLKSPRTATKEALDSLPQRQQQVITARFLEDKTVDEVCRELHLPAKVVHNYTSLGLTRLEPLLAGMN